MLLLLKLTLAAILMLPIAVLTLAFFQTLGDTLTPLVPVIISVGTPFIVKWATDLVIWIFPKLTGWGVVLLVVPVLGAVVTLVTNALTTAGPAWYLQLLLGVLSVFINEVYKQIKQGGTPTAAGAAATAAAVTKKP